MAEEVKTKKKYDFSEYAKVVGFLMLEVLGIVGFSLGSSFLFFTILALLMFVLTILVTMHQINRDGVANIGFFLFPIVIYGILSAVSYLYLDPNYIFHDSFIRFLIPFGLLAFAGCGYLSSMNKSFNIRHALIVIYSGIALLTLINFVVTMIQFVPFYTLRYSNYYIYYNGARSPKPISEMAYFLMNFSLVEVSLSYFSFYPIILLTAFLPLSFIKYSENKKLFIAYASFGALGLVSLIFTITKMRLLILFLIAIVIGFISICAKFNVNRKYLKIAGRVFVGLFIFGVLFLLLNAQDSVGYEFAQNFSFIRKLTTSNSLFNRLFNSNYFVSKYNGILDGTFTKTKLIGYPLINPEDNFGVMTWPLTDSNNFFFDSFFTSGLFGVIFLGFFVFAGLRRVFMYFEHSEDQQADKIMVLGFVVVSLTYAFIAFDATPYIFSETIRPFYTNNIFLIDLFLIGYCYFKTEKKVKVQEVKPREKVQVE